MSKVLSSIFHLIACWKSSMLQRIMILHHWSTRLTQRNHPPVILPSCWKSESIDRLNWVHTNQIFQLAEVLLSMINLVFIVFLIAKLISKFCDLFNRDQSTMIWYSYRTNCFVNERLMGRFFCWNLLTSKNLARNFLLLFSALLIVSWIPSNTFDLDALFLLSGVFIFLKVGEIDLLELIILVSYWWRSWICDGWILFERLLWGGLCLLNILTIELVWLDGSWLKYWHSHIK